MNSLLSPRRERGDTRHRATGPEKSLRESSLACTECHFGVERDLHVLPCVVALIAQHVEGLAFQHCAARSFGGNLICRRRSTRYDHRWSGESSIPGEANLDHDNHFLGIFDTGRNVPKLLQPSDQCIKFGLGQRCCWWHLRRWSWCFGQFRPKNKFVGCI